MYVASDPDFLEREVRVKVGEDYYLAKYKCKKAFKVGTLFDLEFFEVFFE